LRVILLKELKWVQASGFCYFIQEGVSSRGAGSTGQTLTGVKGLLLIGERVGGQCGKKIWGGREKKKSWEGAPQGGGRERGLVDQPAPFPWVKLQPGTNGGIRTS